MFVEKPRSAEELRIEELESQVVALQEQLHRQVPAITSPQTVSTQSSSFAVANGPLKRKRSHLHVTKEVLVPDFVSEGILDEDHAITYFSSFFRGCDRYVPIFDQSDTFYSVRGRSSILLNAICAIGCGVTAGASVDNRLLYVRLKRWLTIVILSPHVQTLETVQALLVCLLNVQMRDVC